MTNKSGGFRIGQFLGGLLVFGLTVAVTLWAGQWMHESVESLSWPEATCRIVRSDVTRKAVDDYRLAVCYTYEAAGCEHAGNDIDSPGSSEYIFHRVSERLPLLERYAPGASATCRIDPKDPHCSALVVNPSSASVVAWIPIVVLLLGAALGLGIMTFAFPRPRQVMSARFGGAAIPLVLTGVLGTVFFSVGWIGVIWAGHSLIDLHGRTYVSCPGKVIDKGLVHSSGGKGGTTYAARIVYAYTVDGRKYEGDRRDADEIQMSDRSYASGILASYTIGQTVDVWYDECEPNVSLLTLPSWHSGLFLFGLMMLFAGAGTALLALLVGHLVRQYRGRPAPVTACALPLKRGLPREVRHGMVFACVWNVFVSTFVLVMISAGHVPWMALVIIGLLATFGVWVTYKTVRGWIKCRFGVHARVEVTAALLQPFAEVQANWSLTGSLDYASLGVFVLQFERGINGDARRNRTIKSASAADRTQKVAQLKGHQPGGSFAFVLPEAIQSRQISWELHFVFRDSRNRLLVKDVFRLPM